MNTQKTLYVGYNNGRNLYAYYVPVDDQVRDLDFSKFDVDPVPECPSCDDGCCVRMYLEEHGFVVNRDYY